MKKLLSIMLVIVLGVSCFLCGCGQTDEAVPEAEKPESTKTVDDEDAVIELLAGIDKIKVVQDSTNVDLSKVVTDSKKIVKSIKVKTSKLDTSKEGEYDVTFSVTVYKEAFEAAKEAMASNETVKKNTKTTGETKVITVPVKVAVISESDADKEKDAVVVSADSKVESNTATATKAEAKADESKNSSSETKSDSTKSSSGSSTNSAKGSNSSSKTSNSTSNANSGSSNSSNKSSGNSASNSSNSSSNSNSSNKTTTHTHSWTYHAAVYKTVHHDAVTHVETVHHEEQGEWHQVCSSCGAIVDGIGVQHLKENRHGGYGSTWVVTQAAYDEQVTVVDQAAYDEQVLVTAAYYSCSCGATK